MPQKRLVTFNMPLKRLGSFKYMLGNNATKNENVQQQKKNDTSTGEK